VRRPGQLFWGPTLAQAWDHAAAASIIKLDLQRTDRGLLDELIAFLDPRAGSRRVMISSRDPGALLYLHRRLHQHKLLILAWTVNDGQRLNQLVRLHVDGITTANLAILRALG
jgi:glycerophosphoryl diester phosphodiesterase